MSVADEMLTRTTVYINHPNGKYVVIHAPKCIKDTAGVVSVMDAEGAVYTTHISQMLLVVEPKKENPND